MKIKLINESRQFKLKSIIHELFPFKETWKNLFKSYTQKTPFIIKLKSEDSITKLNREIDQTTGKWIIKGPDGLPLGAPNSATSGFTVDFNNRFNSKHEAEAAMPGILTSINGQTFKINNQELKDILFNKLRIEFVELKLKEFGNQTELTEDDYFDKNKMFLEGLFRYSHQPDKEGKYSSSLKIELGLPKIMIDEFMNSEAFFSEINIGVSDGEGAHPAVPFVKFFIKKINDVYNDLTNSEIIKSVPRLIFFDDYGYDLLARLAGMVINNQTVYEKIFEPMLSRYVNKQTGKVTSDYNEKYKELENYIVDIKNIIHFWFENLPHVPDDSKTIGFHIERLIKLIEDYIRYDIFDPKTGAILKRKALSLGYQRTALDKSKLINDSMKFIHDYVRSYIYHELTHAVQQHKTDPKGFATVKTSRDFEEIRELIGQMESSKNASDLERQNDLLHKYLLDPKEIEAWARTLFYNFQKSKGNINNAILTLDQFESWFIGLSKIANKILTKRNWWSKTEIKKAPESSKLAPVQRAKRGTDYSRLGNEVGQTPRPIPKRTVEECLLAFDSATNTIKLFLKKIDRYIQIHYQQDLDLLSNFQPYLDFYHQNYVSPIKEKYKDILSRPSVKRPLDLGLGHYGPSKIREHPGQGNFDKLNINSDTEIAKLQAERDKKRKEQEEIQLALQRSRQQSTQQLQKRKDRRKYLELDSIQNKLKDLILESLIKSNK